jgi:hypothetical protein
MADAKEEIEEALEHINAALNADETELQNEWVLKKARQALKLELWQCEENRD